VSFVFDLLSEQFAKSESGTVAHLVSDDPTASIELARWEKLTGNRVLESRDEGNIHHFLVRKK
jgi:TusA-related sulfurtransferase